MVKGCGRKFSKVTMNIFNIILLLVGLGVIAVTGWSLGNGGSIPGGWGENGIISSSVILPQALLWAALGLGILAVLVTILGFCAANGKKKHCFSLTIFSILVILIGLAILIIGVWIYLVGSWGQSLSTCPAALTVPTGDLNTCAPPVVYSEPYVQTFLQTFQSCQFDSNPNYCMGTSQEAQICRGIYTEIVDPNAADCATIPFSTFLTKSSDYISPWSFTAGIVLIVLGGVIFFMSLPAFCLCCAPSKRAREQDEIQEEATARRAAAAQQQSAAPVTGNTRYV